MTVDFTWMIGGPQGSGVETAANIFSQVYSKMGYQIFGKREYYSNIKGEHSYFAVRISDEKIRSSVKGTNMLIAFDAETIFRHADDILENGIVIYDSTLENFRVSDVITFENDFKDRLENLLKSKNKEATVKGMLDLASENGGNCELTKKDDTVIHNKVVIDGPSNIPGTMPIHASELYGKNITALLLYMSKDGELNLDLDDEISSGSMFTYKGEITHEQTKIALEAKK